MLTLSLCPHRSASTEGAQYWQLAGLISQLLSEAACSPQVAQLVWDGCCGWGQSLQDLLCSSPAFSPHPTHVAWGGWG